MERVCTTLESEDLRYLEREADKTKRPLANQVRMILSEWVETDKEHKAFVDGGSIPAKEIPRG